MTSEQFLKHLQEHAASFAKAVATNEGEWIIKGFIDVYRRVYSISVDTKIVSKVLELLLFPMFVEFAQKHGLEIELCQHQNFYPDLTFTHTGSGNRFAVDIKSTYRESETKVNGMTLGAFTGYFRNRDSNKNTLYPYSQYAAHFVLGVIYSKCDDVADERKQFSLDDLATIPSVIKDFEFFAQPKFRIATARPGSGNTKNIGSADKIATLISGTGPFASLGEEVYDDYWMFYLTRDMAEAVGVKRPYMNLKTYLEYKQRGTDTLKAHAEEIANLAEDEPENGEAQARYTCSSAHRRNTRSKARPVGWIVVVPQVRVQRVPGEGCARWSNYGNTQSSNIRLSTRDVGRPIRARLHFQGDRVTVAVD